MEDDPDINAFIQWFKSNGGFVDMEVMSITDFPGSGRGAIALCDIPEGHTLFTLPRAITLSTRTSPLPALFGLDAWCAYRLHRGWVGIILCVMWEDAWAHELDVVDDDRLRAQKDAPTKWGPYMRTLPTIFDTPMFWSAEELEELRGTSVIDKIGREEAERAYSEQLVPAIKTSPTLFPPSHLGRWYGLDAYHRAGSRILSRSFTVNRWTGDTEVEENVERDSEVDGNDADEVDDIDPDTLIESSLPIEDVPPPSISHEDADDRTDSDSEDDQEDDPSDVAMVPMADLLNARWGSENAMLFYEPLVLRMVTTKIIKQNEQIFNTYGNPPNSDLLRRYGHVDLVPLHLSSSATSNRLGDMEMKDEEDDRGEVPISHLGNPSDVTEVRADLILNVVQMPDFKCKAKDMHARIEWWLDQGGDDTFLLSSPEPRSHLSAILPPPLISLTRLLILSEADFKSTLSKGKPPKGTLRTRDIEDTTRVLMILDEVFKQQEKLYAGGDAKDDERLLSHLDSLTERKRRAVIVRLGEKRILRDIRQTLMMALGEIEDKWGARCGIMLDSCRKRGLKAPEGVHGSKKTRK